MGLRRANGGGTQETMNCRTTDRPNVSGGSVEVWPCYSREVPPVLPPEKSDQSGRWRPWRQIVESRRCCFCRQKTPSKTKRGQRGPVPFAPRLWPAVWLTPRDDASWPARSHRADAAHWVSALSLICVLHAALWPATGGRRYLRWTVGAFSRSLLLRQRRPVDELQLASHNSRQPPDGAVGQRRASVEAGDGLRRSLL